MAQSMGVEVSVVPLPARALNDNVRMQGLVLPADVRGASRSQSAFMSIVQMMTTSSFADSQRLDIPELNVPLVEGRNTITLVDAVDDDGLFEYEAILNHPEEGCGKTTVTPVLFACTANLAFCM